MTNLDPFQAPAVPQPQSAEYWKALARRNERRARESYQLLLKMRTEIDGLIPDERREVS